MALEPSPLPGQPETSGKVAATGGGSRGIGEERMGGASEHGGEGKGKSYLIQGFK